MKKDYNQFTKSDMPLDSSLDLPSGPSSSSKQLKKPTINAIGPKKPSKPKTPAKPKPVNETEPKKTSNLRKKLAKDSAEFEDLEKLNEENLKSRSSRSRRNQLLIIILSVLLAISIAVVSVIIVLNQVENNCFAFVHGDGNAAFVIEGKELTEFRAPANTRGNTILNVDVKLNIKSTDEYNIKFEVVCYQGNERLSNVLIYEPNRTLFTYTNEGYYKNKETITGGKTIQLYKGIIFDRSYEDTLNSKNFKLELHVYLEKI